MARGVNKVILIGNLGADPETRHSQSGTQVTRISLATSESWKDKDGQQQERTEWHRVVFFGRLAEIADQYLRKGSQAFIEGSLRTNKWQDKDGQDRYTTEIVASELRLLGGRDSDSRDSRDDTRSDRRAPDRTRGPAGGGRKPAPATTEPDFDDDIPF